MQNENSLSFYLGIWFRISFLETSPMENLRSIFEVKKLLSTPPRKTPWNIDRDWQEEIVYHVLIDRFHDNNERLPVHAFERSRGGGSPSRLNQFCGGTLQGVANHLDYIQGLGCTSLWISPAFDTNKQNYHGYGIKNFLDVEPRFGTKEDLVQLVAKAHQRQMRVFWDIMLNHSGGTWYYVGDDKPIYSKG